MTDPKSETVFSYFLAIDGFLYQTCGEIQLKQSADGMGTSGVCSAELTFSVSYEEYALHPPKSGAEVTFVIADPSNVYYDFFISRRTRSGGKVTFVCYDRMIKLGASADELDIEYENVIEGDEGSGDIQSLTLVKLIADKAGFYGVTEDIDNNTSMAYFQWLKIKKTAIEGNDLRSVLETISTAWCGYFTLAADNKLDFCQFGSWTRGYHTICPIDTHSAIRIGTEKEPIKSVVVYSGSNYYYAGEKDGDVLETLKIQTEFASQEYAEALLQRVYDYKYISWSCERAIISDEAFLDGYLPTINTTLSKWHISENVDIMDMVANSLTYYFTNCGVYASFACNEINEDEYEYLGYYSRMLEKKLGYDETLGNNTRMTRYQGLIHLGEAKKDEATGETTQNRYSYSSATSDGVVEFSGALKSKAIPEIQVNSDQSGFTMQYEDTSFEYEVVIDGDNVTLKEKKEAE